MPDHPPQKSPNPGFKLDKDLCPISTNDSDHALINKEHESRKAQKSQSITFDTEAALSPSSKHKLHKALTHENAWPDAKDSTAKEAWVEGKANELRQAFEKGRKAESSTSGFSASADRWSAREGTAQDLRYTLTKVFEKYGPIVLMYKGHDALGRNWVSGWKVRQQGSVSESCADRNQSTKAATKQMTVVICIEKKEGKNKRPVSAASAPADAKQAEIEDK